MVGQLSFGLMLGIFLVFPIHPVPPPGPWSRSSTDGWPLFWPPAYVVFVSLVVSGSSNAVNLTDGLDGLAAGLGAIAS
jgi:phospho-N-acetylmuramoyl-pentapeptide-transferase